MDTIPNPDESTPETEDERQRLLAWKTGMIAEANFEFDAGLYVDAAEIDA